MVGNTAAMPDCSVVTRDDTNVSSRMKCAACLVFKSVMHTSRDTVGSTRDVLATAPAPTPTEPSSSCDEHSEPSDCAATRLFALSSSAT